MNELDTLLEVWEKLQLNERKMVLAYAWRVYAGQRRYGPFTPDDKRDMRYEAIEEALDASVYLTRLLSNKAQQAFDNMVADAEKEVSGG